MLYDGFIIVVIGHIERDSVFLVQYISSEAIH